MIRRKTRAFTLVELCVTMSAGSAMMILAISMLHQSMSLATVSRQRADHQRSLDRLAGELTHIGPFLPADDSCQPVAVNFGAVGE